MGFNERKMDWFLVNGSAIVDRVTNSSNHRSKMMRYDRIRKSLQNTLFYKNNGMESSIYYFGSRLGGYSASFSDLDLFVDVGNLNYWSQLDTQKSVKILDKIARAMRSTKIWEVKVLIRNTQVPLIRAVHLPTNYECDIVASNGVSVALSEILRYVNSLQPEIISLYHHIRICLSLHNVRMKRYVQYLLVLFYLQRKRLIPTMEMVQKNLYKKCIDGLEIQYDNRRNLNYYQIQKIHDYKNLVLGFYHYYANLDFQNDVLSTYNGSTTKKKDFHAEGFNINKPLCIAGPLDRNRNSGQSVQGKTLESFQTICKSSYSFYMKKGWKK